MAPIFRTHEAPTYSRPYREFSLTRSACEQSQKFHLENPYWQTFDKYVVPLLSQPIELRRFNELDTTSKEVKVETDKKMWEETEKYQMHETHEQGNY